MSTLVDQIDRFHNIARSIKTTAGLTLTSLPERGGPLADAALHLPLGDLIRDVDPSELGLFTLNTSKSVSLESDLSGPSEVTRVEVVSATPLRKQAVTRQEAVRSREPEPEVYVTAALKYMERYASVRPMPRAQAQAEAIVEQLAGIRENMRLLEDELARISTGNVLHNDRSASPKALAMTEEHRIRELQANIKRMQERKEVLQRERTTTLSRNARPHRPPLKHGAQEDAFWNTPGSKLPVSQLDDDLLLHEHVDVADVTSSFDSPLIHRTSRSGRADIAADASVSTIAANTGDDLSSANLVDQIIQEDEDAPSEADMEPEGATVVLSEKPSSPLSSPPRHATAVPDESISAIELELNTTLKTVPEAADCKKQKVRITMNVEHIVAKIWSTVGDVIMPGHQFDVSGNSGSKPPRAKATIAHLQRISTEIPTPPSPTASSLSSLSSTSALPGQVTLQQALTAQMLLALLSSPPEFSLPLSKVKESLGTGTGPVHPGSMAALPTRVLYSCVAKKLIKIERGGGEQVVRFDVL